MGGCFHSYVTVYQRVSEAFCRLDLFAQSSYSQLVTDEKNWIKIVGGTTFNGLTLWL